MVGGSVPKHSGSREEKSTSFCQENAAGTDLKKIVGHNGI